MASSNRDSTCPMQTNNFSMSGFQACAESGCARCRRVWATSRQPESLQEKLFSGCVCRRLNEMSSLLDIQTGAQSGCQFCSILWNNICDFSDIDLDTREKIVAESHVVCEGAYVKVLWRGGPPEYLQIFTLPDPDGWDPYFEIWGPIVRRHMISTPGSQAFFGVIKDWIADCTENHFFCRTLTNSATESSISPQLPTRVLRINLKDDRFEVNLQDTPIGSEKYVALSHCWGKQQPDKQLPWTTTKKSLPDRKAGINWAELPRTFQHAIIITAALDVKYIWIDSLCIIQDDKSDWVKESEMMSSIYENSWLTVAAAAAPDGTFGCFPIAQRVTRHEIQTNNKNEAAIIFVRKIQNPIDSRKHLIKVSNTLPLFQRAWVLQERLLARRILHLCNDEMAFECATNVRCECSGPCIEEVAQTVDGTSFAGIKYRYHSLLNQWLSYSYSGGFPRRFGPTGILEFWDHIVHQYTRRKLTYYEDRLPALAGIAKTIHGIRALGHYIDGLWEERLAEGLLWYVDVTTPGSDPLPPDSGPPTAPSWSWASIKGPWNYVRKPLSKACLYVEMNRELSLAQPQAKVLSLQTYLAESNLFGPVKLKKLKFAAPMNSAVILYSVSDTAQDYTTRFKNQKVQLKKGNLVAEPYVDLVLDYGENPVMPEEIIQCVAIQNDWEPFHGWGEESPCHGLIITRCLRNGEEVYRRIGKVLFPFGWFEGAKIETLTMV